MSFSKESVPPIILLPSYDYDPQDNLPKPLAYPRLIIWLYKFPQALEKYIDLLEDDEPTHDPHRQNQLLNKLTGQVTFIGVVLFVSLSFIWGFFRIIGDNELQLLNRWLTGCVIGALLLSALGIGLIVGNVNSSGAQIKRLLRLRRLFITNIFGITLFGVLLFVLIFDPAAAPAPTLSYMLYMAVVAGFLTTSFTRIYFRSPVANPTLNLALSSFILVATLSLGLFLGFLFANLEDFTWPDNLLRQGVIVLLLSLSIYLIGVLRPDDWLWAQRYYKSEKPEAGKLWPIPHVTLLPYGPIETQLKWQFNTDWKSGLANAHEIVLTSSQKLYVLHLIREFLHKTDTEKNSKNVVEQAMTLLESKFGDEEPYLLLAPNTGKLFRQKTKPKVIATIQKRKNLLAVPKDLWKLVRDPPEKKPQPLIKPKASSFVLQTDSLSRAAMAGVWHLQQWNPDAAAKAFTEIKNSDYGKELQELAEAFKEIAQKQDLANNPELKFAKKPEKPKHEEAWNALNLIKETAQMAWVYKQCRQDKPADYHPKLRQMALLNVRKIQIIKRKNGFKKTEESFLNEFTLQWRKLLLHEKSFWSARDPKLEPLDPNPYVYAEAPDEKRIFVGRKKQLGQINEAWRTDNFQNVLLYGARRTGKTSLLHKADIDLKEKVDVAHINLAQTLPKAGLAELFMDITSEVGKELSLPPPDYSEMVRSPMRTLREFLHQCSEQFGKNSLVIAFDKFEYIDEILPHPHQRDRFTYFLVHATRQIQNIGFVCVTTMPPPEFSTRFGQAFAASLTPIEVNNFQAASERADVAQFYRRPVPKWPYFLDEAIDQILALTGGNPYLLQLVGHFVVQVYNKEIKENNDKIKKKEMDKAAQRDPVITAHDIKRTVENKDFQEMSKRYFVDILEQAQNISCIPGGVASNSAPKADYADMLRRVARGETPRPKKRSKQEKAALEGLLQHNLIIPQNDQFTIASELLQAWLKTRK